MAKLASIFILAMLAFCLFHTEAITGSLACCQPGRQLSQVPFISSSLWNQKVSVSAIYTTISWPASGSPATGGNVYAYDVTWANTGFPVYVATSTDPVVAVTCPASWGWSANPSLHIPIGATGANPTGNGWDTPIIVIDNNVAWNFWRFVRTSNTTATAQSQGRANITTDTGFGALGGNGAGISAAGSSELGGLLVQAQTDTGPITHALQLYVANELLDTSYVAPAISTDGPTPGAPLKEGMLLAIPSGTAMPGGLSPLGQKVFTALQQYGAYITERGGQGASGIRSQQNGYNATVIAALKADLQTVFLMLKIVT